MDVTTVPELSSAGLRKQQQPSMLAKPAIGILAVLLVCAAAYAPGLAGPLFFDDLPNLTQSTYLALDARLADAWRIAIISNDSGVLHRPVAMATFAINHALLGELSPMPLKVTNLCIHLGIGLLLYAWFMLLLASPALRGLVASRKRRRQLALLAAAIWLLHPLHVSTVLYAVQRMAQLSALFVVLGLWMYTRYRLRWVERGAGPGEVLAAGLWIALVTLLAVLSKENGALLVWLLAVTEVFLFRGSWQGGERVGLKRLAWIALLLPVIAVLLLFLLNPDVFQARYASREFSLSERVLTQCRILWAYLYWYLLPNLGQMGFHHDDLVLSSGLWQPRSTAVAIFAWVVVLALAVFWRKRLPLFGFAVCFYLVGHSMESSFWPLEMVYEHRNYLPATAVSLLMAWLVFQLVDRTAWLQPAMALALVMVCLAVPLALRASVWGDELRLARHNVVNHPQSPRANFFYGNALFKRFNSAAQLGLPEQERKAYLVLARDYFIRMHELNPRDLAALVMLYQIDNSFLSALPDRPDWLSRINALAQTRKLQSSDRTALAALIDYAERGVPEQAYRRIWAVLEILRERYPTSAHLYTHQYKLLQARQSSQHEGLTVLQNARSVAPSSRWVYPFMVQHQGSGNAPETFEAIRAWMDNDPRRLDLIIIRRLFSLGDKAQ